MTEMVMPAKPICVSTDSFLALFGSSGEIGDPGRTALLVICASPPAVLQCCAAPAHLYHIPR